MDDEKPEQEGGERPHIKVTDRRKFAPDGTLRTGEATAEPDRAEDATPPTAATTPPAGTDDDAPPRGHDPATAPGAGEQPATPTADSAAAPFADSPLDPDAGAAIDEDASRIATPQPRISDLPRDFLAFVESMYFEAMLYMGAIADPRSGQLVEDPELAKYKIDLLAMLQEKTEGNLSADEKRQLDDVLYQLRMLYLQKTKAANL